MSVINNFLSDVELAYINNLPEVIESKTKLISSSKVYFNIEVTETIRNVLHEKFGLEFSGNTIPMRWIKGDTSPHIDHGASKFENTYLVYLNDSPGTFLIGNEAYDILENTGYVFNEGITHSTENTGTVPRLLMGPMNEFAQPVGGGGIFYYDTQQHAAAGSSDPIGNTDAGYLGSSSVTVVNTYGSTWTIDHTTGTGVNSINPIQVGDLLNDTNGNSHYYVYQTSVVVNYLSNYWKEYAVTLRLLREYNENATSLTVTGWDDSIDTPHGATSERANSFILSKIITLNSGDPVMFMESIAGVTVGITYYAANIESVNNGTTFQITNSPNTSTIITLPIGGLTSTVEVTDTSSVEINTYAILGWRDSNSTPYGFGGINEVNDTIFYEETPPANNTIIQFNNSNVVGIYSGVSYYVMNRNTNANSFQVSLNGMDIFGLGGLQPCVGTDNNSAVYNISGWQDNNALNYGYDATYANYFYAGGDDVTGISTIQFSRNIAGVNTATTYYVINNSTYTFQISTDGTTPLTLPVSSFTATPVVNILPFYKVVGWYDRDENSYGDAIGINYTSMFKCSTSSPPNNTRIKFGCNNIGISSELQYYVINSSGNKFQISNSISGDLITIKPMIYLANAIKGIPYYTGMYDTIVSKFTNLKELLQNAVQFSQDSSLVISRNFITTETSKFLSDFSGWTSTPQYGGFGYDLQNTFNIPYPTQNLVQLWTIEIATHTQSIPTIGNDGTIYIGSSDSYLYALNPNGFLKWKYLTGGDIYSSPSIGIDGTIYTGSDDYNLYALYSDGTLKWKFLTIGLMRSSPKLGTDGTIYVMGDYILYAINLDGTLKWSVGLDDTSYATPAISLDGKTIYASGGGYMYAINSKDGKIIWQYNGGSVWISPLVGSDGTVYAGCNGGIYAFTGGVDFSQSINTPIVSWLFPTLDTPTCLALKYGFVYVGDADGNIYEINSTNPSEYNSNSTSSVSGYRINSMLIDSMGRIAIANSNGISLFNTTFQFISSNNTIGINGVSLNMNKTLYASGMNGIVYALG